MPMIQKTKPTSMTEVNSELYKSNMWRPQADFKTGGSDVVAMNAVQEGKSSGQRLAETLGVAAGLVKESAVAAATVQKYSNIEDTKFKASSIGFGNAYQSALKEQGYFLSEANEAKRQELITNLRDTLYIQYLGDYPPEYVKKHQRLIDAMLGETQIYLHQANQKAVLEEANSATSVVLSHMTNKMLKTASVVDGYGARPDGTAKGQGWLGPIPLTNSDGSTGVMTEVTTKIELDGKSYDAPLLVPGLTNDEVQAVGTYVTTPKKTDKDGQAAWEALPDSIKRKASEHLISSLNGKTPLYAPFTPEKDIRQAYSDYYTLEVRGKPGDPGRDAFARTSINTIREKMTALASSGDFVGANRLLKVLSEPDRDGNSWALAKDSAGNRKFGADIDAAEADLITITKNYYDKQEKVKTQQKVQNLANRMVEAFGENTDPKTFLQSIEQDAHNGLLTGEQYSTLKQTFTKAQAGGYTEDSLTTYLDVVGNAGDGKLTPKKILQMVQTGQIKAKSTAVDAISAYTSYQNRMAQGEKEGESYIKQETAIYLGSLQGLKQSFDIKVDPDGSSRVNAAIQLYRLKVLRRELSPRDAYELAVQTYDLRNEKNKVENPKNPTTPMYQNGNTDATKANAKKGVQLLNAK